MESIFRQQLKQVTEVAAILWQKGWAECNGGNISLNLTASVDQSFLKSKASFKAEKLLNPVPELANQIFYISGAGKRMRDVAKAPLDEGSIFRITEEGESYEILSDCNVKPSSELPSHLSIHAFLKSENRPQTAVLHTHPTELIALSHSDKFLDSGVLTKTLWSMIPETRVLVPKGIGVVPYMLTGTQQLADASLKQLHKYDVVLWEKHGVLAIGNDLLHCLDMIDALSKSAQIYLFARTAGFEPIGLSEKQLKELKDAFGLE